MYKLLVILLIAFSLSGCGGGGGGSTHNSNTNSSNDGNQKAYLIDSAISGVEYTCGEISGITKEDGEFIYNSNCKVIFKLGGIVLGNIDGLLINEDKSVLPSDILGLERTNTSDEKIINLIQFLQSIDDDDNPDNNIVITSKSREAFKDCKVDFTEDATHLDEIREVMVLINKKLVTRERALKHYQGVLSKRFGIDIVKEESVVVIEEEIAVVEIVIEKEIPVIEEIKEEVEEVIEEKIIVSEIVIEKEMAVVEEIIEEEITVVEEVIEEEISIGEETTNNANNGFSYNNQRRVSINIFGKSSQIDKQILIYEKLEIHATPVGDLEKLENLIISTILDDDGDFNVIQTLGNHIQSVWLLIPYYRIQVQVPIVNNNIYFRINTQGDSL
jgi:hypothetical protein